MTTRTVVLRTFLPSAGSPFGQILGLYPVKGEFTLYYPAYTSSGFRASFVTAHQSTTWHFFADTAEEALAKAMAKLVAE
jgi:hypothetical protein